MRQRNSMSHNALFNSQLLAELRIYKGFTQRAFANEAGISRSQLNRIEAGDVVPTLPSIIKITEHLGVAISALVNTNLNSPGVHFFHSGEMERWDEIHQFIRNSKRITTITRKIDSFLQSDSMLRVLNPWCFETENATEKFTSYVEMQREAFLGSNFIQWMVFPVDLFSVLRIEHANWLNAFLDRLGALGRPTYLAPVENYAELVDRVKKQLPMSLRGWDKVLSLIHI